MLRIEEEELVLLGRAGVVADAQFAGRLGRNFPCLTDLVELVDGECAPARLERRETARQCRLMALLGPGEMSDLSPQSGPKRTLVILIL